MRTEGEIFAVRVFFVDFSENRTAYSMMRSSSIALVRTLFAAFSDFWRVEATVFGSLMPWMEPAMLPQPKITPRS